ncbi:MAG: hypothetical protein WEG36_05845 [Gemmatimonadota bacterium]
MRGAFWVPLALTAGLVLLSFTPRVLENEILARSFWGAAVALLAWQAIYFLRTKRLGTLPKLLLATPRRQHYIQALCQISVFAYWGWYWRPVYGFALLLVGQLAFAYAFDMLLQWWRRGSYLLGFGPFPIIFSVNLFLWFRDDWFFLQFLMLAVGFLGKEFVKWEREGKKTHIFNPSAFALGLFSLILIVTGTTELTWGQEIASTLSLAPRIYLFLFLVGLVVMYFFSITLVASAAAAVLFGLSALHSWWAGVPYFLDTEIPAAVFLGLHLLVTDPSTSPRTPPGKLVFGALYGAGVFALYSLLGALGAPTFYDKLLIVPLLNLSVQRIDRLVQRIPVRPLLGRVWPGWTPARLNVAHIGIWIAFFALMTATGRTDGRHTGDSLPFWEAACADGRRTGCERLLQLQYAYCADNSGWACNELGRHLFEGTITEADQELALQYFSRSCELRFQAACLNLLSTVGDLRKGDPRVIDLRVILREGGANLLETPEPELYARACEHDWTFACGRVTGAL